MNLLDFGPNSVKSVQLKWLVLGAIVIFVLGFAFGRYGVPSNTTTKTQTKTTSVENTTNNQSSVSDTKENTEHKQQIHTIKTTKPDGTVTEESYILNDDTKYVEVDKSKNQSSTSDKTETTATSTQTSTKSATADWRASALAGVNYGKVANQEFKDAIIYGASIERRLLGPVYGGAWGNTAKEVGLSLGVQF